MGSNSHRGWALILARPRAGNSIDWIAQGRRRTSGVKMVEFNKFETKNSLKCSQELLDIAFRRAYDRNQYSNLM